MEKLATKEAKFQNGVLGEKIGGLGDIYQVTVKVQLLAMRFSRLQFCWAGSVMILFMSGLVCSDRQS